MRAPLTASVEVDGWEPTRWYRVMSPNGRVWCESSDPVEVAEAAAEIGEPVERMWREIPRCEWRRADG